MRARFVAFGLGRFDFLEATQVEPLAEEVRQGEAPEWESLKILSCSAGGTEDSSGAVEFVAHYHQNGCRNHHERSHFVRRDGVWKFLRGDLIEQGTVRRHGPKVGRNDPCPCQSGKKYKRCCGVVTGATAPGGC